MDKKSAKYSQQSANKSATAESKKTQDVVNGKAFPKPARRREPPGANGYQKNEQSRKSGNYQKTRNFDKRPKPKGQYYGGSKEDSKVVDEEAAEVGSVMAPGSKKQNLNHLLNFHYEPRDVVHSGWNNFGRSNHNNNNRWLPPVQRHKYNKELFLQANCQFVVTSDGDYSVQLVDPDILVDWKFIEQIRIFTGDSLSCPICLYPPVAGKMTRCGHVYCWPCILHYLSLSDKKSRKCPICDELVYKSDLKSVVQINQQAFNIGDTLNLRLMRRKRGSLLAVPVGANIPDPDNFLGFSDQGVDWTYSKLLRAGVKDVIDIIETERVHLMLELNEAPNSPENCFIEQALAELVERERKMLDQTDERHGDIKVEVEATVDGGSGGNEIVEEEKSTEITGKDYENNRKLVKNGENSFEVNENEDPNNKSAENFNKSTGSDGKSGDNCTKLDNVPDDMMENEKSDELLSPKNESPPNQSKFFYFYQAEGGQHVYLHAMNVKMLELQYGDLEHSPHTLTGKIVEKETGSFTEELRKRMRYLCHLPLTCNFEIAEIELTTPTVSKDVLYYFKEQLEARERRRKRKDRDEKKREKKITAEENKKIGVFPTPNVHIESHRHFPRWQNESASSSMTIPTPPESIASSSVASSPGNSTFGDIQSYVNDTMWPSPPQHDQGPSFAQMLRTDRMTNSTKNWPSISPSAPPLPRPQTRKPNTAVVTSQNDEDYLQAPSHSQSFGDVLAMALEASTIQDEALPKGKNKKSKKKGKAKLLFASGMTRTS